MFFMGFPGNRPGITQGSSGARGRLAIVDRILAVGREIVWPVLDRLAVRIEPDKGDAPTVVRERNQALRQRAPVGVRKVKPALRLNAQPLVGVLCVDSRVWFLRAAGKSWGAGHMFGSTAALGGGRAL